MSRTNEYNSAFFIHISALLGFLFPFAEIIIPFLLWKGQKKENTFLETNGKEAVNFNITFGIYRLVLAISLVIVFFTLLIQQEYYSIPALIAVFILFEITRVALIIIAATKAKDAEEYHYPMTIQFFK